MTQPSDEVVERACRAFLREKLVNDHPKWTKAQLKTSIEYNWLEWRKEILAAITEAIAAQREEDAATIADLRFRLAEETATVDRIWKLLGIATYEQAGGLSIYEHIEAAIRKARPTPGETE